MSNSRAMEALSLRLYGGLDAIGADEHHLEHPVLVLDDIRCPQLVTRLP